MPVGRIGWINSVFNSVTKSSAHKQSLNWISLSLTRGISCNWRALCPDSGLKIQNFRFQQKTGWPVSACHNYFDWRSGFVPKQSASVTVPAGFEVWIEHVLVLIWSWNSKQHSFNIKCKKEFFQYDFKIRKVKVPANEKNAKKFQMKNIYYCNIPTVLFRFYRVIRISIVKKWKNSESTILRKSLKVKIKDGRFVYLSLESNLVAQDWRTSLNQKMFLHRCLLLKIYSKIDCRFIWIHYWGWGLLLRSFNPYFGLFTENH